MIATWIFDIGAYRYSTQAVTYSSVSYTAKILPDSFPGITMGWDIGGSGLIYPTDIEFDIDNADGVLTRGDLEGEFCTIKLLTNGTLCRTWKFEIQAAILSYGKITVYCVGILQKYLTGNYPNTPHPREVWVSANHEPEDGKYDAYRIPVIFGTAYIPSMYIYHTVNDTGYYVLGADIAYTVTEVTAPPESGKTVWPSSGYTFNQTSDAGYKLIEFVIAPTGTTPAYTEGTWPSDQKPLVKYSKTSGSTTAPATIISTVLQDFGVPSGDIDTSGTFASAATTYASQGITWNGGFYQVESRESVLSNLLAQCDSTLFVSDKIELRPFSKTSKETFTTAKTKKLSYRPSKATQYVADSGHVAWADAGFPQENLVGKAIVPIDASTANPDSEVFKCRFIGDAEVAQTLGTLYFQRKLGGKDSISFSTPGPVMTTLATLKPADVITVNDTMFGGSQAMIVSELHIDRDLTVNISGRSLFVLQEFADITPSAVVVTEDTLVPNLGGSTDGANGDSVDIVFVRSATAPVTPTASTGVPNAPIQWYTDVAGANAVGGFVIALWSSVGKKTAGIGNYTWETPSQVTGASVAEVVCYVRASSTPSTPTTGGTYTFSSPPVYVAPTAPIAWYTYIPSGTNPVYTSRAVVSTAAGNTAAVTISGWTSPVLSMQNGTDGAPGSTGPTGPGLVYRGTFVSGTAYYNSSTRRDVVLYSGSYYLFNGTNGAASYSISDFVYFSATFSSVATDLLLAQDVAITRTLNIGDGTGSNTAGMSGLDSASTSVRIWSGGARDSAAFRVNQAGNVYATGYIYFDNTSTFKLWQNTAVLAMAYAYGSYSSTVGVSSGIVAISALGSGGTVSLVADNTIQVNRGIKFPSSPVSSADHANTLDDYEEGEYTPTIEDGGGSATLSTSYDRLSYTKIGRAVTITGQLRFSAVTVGTGTFYISVPITPVNPEDGSGNTAVSCVIDGNGTLPAAGTLCARIIPGVGSKIGLTRYGTTGINYDAAAYITVNTIITLNCTYIAAT